jgi:hypothetical protein
MKHQLNNTDFNHYDFGKLFSTAHIVHVVNPLTNDCQFISFLIYAIFNFKKKLSSILKQNFLVAHPISLGGNELIYWLKLKLTDFRFVHRSIYHLCSLSIHSEFIFYASSFHDTALYKQGVY